MTLLTLYPRKARIMEGRHPSLTGPIQGVSLPPPQLAMTG